MDRLNGLFVLWPLLDHQTSQGQMHQTVPSRGWKERRLPESLPSLWLLKSEVQGYSNLRSPLQKGSLSSNTLYPKQLASSFYLSLYLFQIVTNLPFTMFVGIWSRQPRGTKVQGSIRLRLFLPHPFSYLHCYQLPVLPEKSIKENSLFSFILAKPSPFLATDTTVPWYPILGHDTRPRCHPSRRS